MLRGADIVCVGLADWRAELPTSQHHLMSRLAEANRVLFIESLGLRRPQLARRDVSRMVRRARAGARGMRPDGDLHVLPPLAIPLHGTSWMRRLNAALLRRQVEHATERLGMSDVILWAYSPHAETLIDSLGPSTVVNPR